MGGEGGVGEWGRGRVGVGRRVGVGGGWVRGRGNKHTVTVPV